MNPTPVAVAESQVNERLAIFLGIYSSARRSARVRSAAAVVSASLAPADREDWEQEALTAVWRALPRYDPSRASLRTYVEHVIKRRFASLVRAQRPTLQLLEEHHSVGLDGIPGVEYWADFHRASVSLAEGDRRLARFLVDHSPTEAGRILGVSHSKVYGGIRRIRTAFAQAGLGPRPNRPIFRDTNSLRTSLKHSIARNDTGRHPESILTQKNNASKEKCL